MMTRIMTRHDDDDDSMMMTDIWRNHASVSRPPFPSWVPGAPVAMGTDAAESEPEHWQSAVAVSQLPRPSPADSDAAGIAQIEADGYVPVTVTDCRAAAATYQIMSHNFRLSRS